MKHGEWCKYPSRIVPEVVIMTLVTVIGRSSDEILGQAKGSMWKSNRLWKTWGRCECHEKPSKTLQCSPVDPEV